MSGLYKRYVNVIVEQRKDGSTIPLYVVWDDGKKYEVDRVVKVDRHVSVVGGGGIRFACLICGKRRNLFLEKNRWFIESFQP